MYSVQKKLYSLYSFTIEISCPLGYTIITPREHDLPGQAKRTDELKETQKKFKKGLDKNKGLWYNKSVKRARYHPLTATQSKPTLKEVMCMTKMTYAAALSHVLTTCEMPEEVRAKLVALSESLAKKASAEKKPTAKQKETAEVAQTLLAQLKENGNALTVSEMIAQLPVCEGMSNQKVSALVRSLGSAVERVEEKRKAYFRAV